MNGAADGAGTQAVADSTTYHLEDGIWWLEDSRLPGFTAVGESPDEVTAMLIEALRHDE